MPKRIVSHYELAEVLGRGGMGVVYRATDLNLHREVAVKFCSEASTDPAIKRRLGEEARAASRLNHPNIAHVYDYGEDESGEPFIVMEYVAGRGLREVLGPGPLPVKECRRIAAAVASALGEAHFHGIIHRDIKPGNIRIAGRGEVKVLDFGLAKRMEGHVASGETTVSNSLPGFIRGTPPYMAPEQARGLAMDGRTDLFALGAVLYECLTGRRAFPGETQADVLAQVIQGQPPVPSSIRADVPPELDRIVLRLLEKEPQNRYANAEEVLRDLNFEGSHENSSAVTLTWHSARALIRPRWRWAAGVALAAAVFAGAWYWTWGRVRRPSPEAAHWHQQGVLALRDGSYHKASKALQQAVSFDKGFALAHARLAEAWFELDLVNRAKQEMLLANPPGSSLSAHSKSDALMIEAIHAMVTGNDAVSVEKYRKRIGEVDASERAWAEVDLGRALERAADAKAALDAYRRAEAIDSQCAFAYLRMGTIDGRQRRFEEAAKAFDTAEQLYGAASNLEGQAEVNYARGVMWNQGGRFEQARPYLDRALESARATGNEQQQIKGLIQASTLEAALGNVAQAEKLAASALELSRKAGIENLATRAMMESGNALMQRGEREAAKRYYEQALVLARQNGAAKSEMDALVNLSGFRIKDGQRSQAVAELEQALRFYDAGGFQRQGNQTRILLGRALRSQGDYARAQSLFEELLDAANKRGNAQEIALAQEGIGQVLFREERYREAFKRFEESRRQSQLAKAAPAAGHASLNMARIALAFGKLDEALRLLSESQQTAVSARLKGLRSFTELRLGEVELAEGRAGAALKRIDAARALLDGADPEDNIEFGLPSIAALTQLGRTADAVRECEKVLLLAAPMGDPWHLGRGELACAGVYLAAGARARSEELASRALRGFMSAGQPQSEWRARVMLARLSPGDGEARSRARDALRRLEQGMGTDFTTYRQRRDVRADVAWLQ